MSVSPLLDPIRPQSLSRQITVPSLTFFHFARKNGPIFFCLAPTNSYKENRQMWIIHRRAENNVTASKCPSIHGYFDQLLARTERNV